MLDAAFLSVRVGQHRAVPISVLRLAAFKKNIRKTQGGVLPSSGLLGKKLRKNSALGVLEIWTFLGVRSGFVWAAYRRRNASRAVSHGFLTASACVLVPSKLFPLEGRVFSGSPRRCFRRGFFRVAAFREKLGKNSALWRANRAGQHSSVAVTVLDPFPQNMTFIDHSHAMVLVSGHRYTRTCGDVSKPRAGQLLPVSFTPDSLSACRCARSSPPMRRPRCATAAHWNSWQRLKTPGS